ncbi:MAG: type II toxin-antitoxin system RelE/ParE family toxin [Bauldia sp.]
MYEAIFFRTASGNVPALDWFRGLEPEERRIVGYDLRVLQIGFPMGMPLCKPLGHGLWELRSTLPGKIARVIFFIDGSRFIIVHGFIKKSEKTPKKELETAKARKRLYEPGAVE